MTAAATPASSMSASALTQRLSALPESERQGALLEILREEVAQVLGLGSGHEVNPATSL